MTIRSKLLLALRGLLALLFVAAGTAKLLAQPMMVEEFALFAPYGVGQWLRIVTGLIEIVGAGLLIRASTAFAGAILLLGVCVGAGAAQLAVIHQDVVHVVIIGALLAWIAWRYRPPAFRADAV